MLGYCNYIKYEYLAAWGVMLYVIDTVNSSVQLLQTLFLARWQMFLRNPLFQTYKEIREDERELDCEEEKYLFVNNSEDDTTKMQNDELMHCLMSIGPIRFLEDGWHINILPEWG